MVDSEGPLVPLVDRTVKRGHLWDSGGNGPFHATEEDYGCLGLESVVQSRVMICKALTALSS